MKRFINGLQWAALVGVVVLIAWIVLKPAPPVIYEPGTWSNWEGFMTLSYAGVTRSEGDVYASSETLASHLEALAKVGYNTITPEDALAFLEGRAPLPERALLILFEGARKETFIRAHPALRRLGLRATLCVSGESIESWDESRLKSGDVRKIVMLPQWSLASMGHEAVNPIQSSADGSQDHFLSTRKWLPKLNRTELDGEFSQRIEADYTRSSQLLEKLNGSPVAAYVYPFSDDGRRAGGDPLAAQLNTSNVTARYKMAFVSASNPFNPPGRDPYRLSRLRVGGDWSAAQVLTSLQHARPLSVPLAGIGSAENWSFLNGARIAGEVLRLDSEDAAWVRGSELWTDTEVSVVLSREPGTVASLYARFINPTHCLRLSVDDKTIRLQESRGGGASTLAAAPAPAGESLRLVWRVKGVRSWLMVNGLPVLGPVPLSPPQPSGFVGFESSKGKISFSELRLAPITRQGIQSDSWGTIPEEKRGLATDTMMPFPPLGTDLSAQQVLDIIQAVAEGVTVWPKLTAGTNSLPVATGVETMTAMLAAKDIKPFIKGFVLDASQAEWIEPLRQQGFKVMHHIRVGETIPLAATNRGDHVWLEGTGSNAVAAARAFLHLHPPSQLVVGDDSDMARIPGVGRVTEWKSPGGK
jgi:peptidoglycan/xylan/chitin deacetylase (PgdA/CDA1 family)